MGEEGMDQQLSDADIAKWVPLVAKELYEIVFKDPWFKKIFRNVEQEIITNQQIDFMTKNLGGPNHYCGRSPKDAHPQVWVDENIWAYRVEVLNRAFDAVDAPMEFREKWHAIDHAFKNVIINCSGPEECVGRFKMEEIIYEPMPDHVKARMPQLEKSLA